ncbi:hypothetical protein [Sphaerisporangium perillae]|uniref:hypothetical protein n=1 Tax=Sphaerisporangium perillae TaxID=2935860 RepID=UPI00200E5AC2|nr:hypothetical protein [Sphaerisporangium perillae]
MDDTPRDLYAAIGRVAAESVNIEATLRWIFREYVRAENDYPAGENLNVLFERQSWDWLIENLRAVLKARSEYDAHDFGEYDDLLRVLGSLSDLWSRRNLVIHGVWQVCDPEEGCRLWASPPAQNDESPVYHFFRSRLRHFDNSETHLTISDIERLADELKRADSLLASTWESSLEAHLLFQQQMSEAIIAAQAKMATSEGDSRTQE